MATRRPVTMSSYLSGISADSTPGKNSLASRAKYGCTTKWRAAASTSGFCCAKYRSAMPGSSSTLIKRSVPCSWWPRVAFSRSTSSMGPASQLAPGHPTGAGDSNLWPQLRAVTRNRQYFPAGSNDQAALEALRLAFNLPTAWACEEALPAA